MLNARNVPEPDIYRIRRGVPLSVPRGTRYVTEGKIPITRVVRPARPLRDRHTEDHQQNKQRGEMNFGPAAPCLSASLPPQTIADSHRYAITR